MRTDSAERSLKPATNNGLSSGRTARMSTSDPSREQHVLDRVLAREPALVRRRGGLGLLLGVVAGNRRRLAAEAHEIPARGARLDVAAHGVGE